MSLLVVCRKSCLGSSSPHDSATIRPHPPVTDWGVEGGGPCRYVTLLLYLNEPTAGGQTAFPKATDPATGKQGLAIHPGKGSAVLFYNLLPDGNADSETLHAALPVIEGDKWLANFWIWDPIMKG